MLSQKSKSNRPLRNNPLSVGGTNSSVCTDFTDMDEYDAIMKFELLNHHETENNRKETRLAAKRKLQEELVKQQAEFLERQRLQKEDMRAYEDMN